MASGFLRGALSGAAGTAALNASTYLDMAVRGRSGSGAPQDVVEKSAEKVGLDIPGQGSERDNRLEALGPLSGTATGVTVGAIAGSIHHQLARRGKHLPAWVEIALMGAGAMALADVPMKLLGVSDPRTWGAKAWLSDAVPHLVYGAVTYAGLKATTDQ